MRRGILSGRTGRVPRAPRELGRYNHLYSRENSDDIQSIYRAEGSLKEIFDIFFTVWAEYGVMIYKVMITLFKFIDMEGFVFLLLCLWSTLYNKVLVIIFVNL